MDYTKYLYFLIAVPPILIAIIELAIKLKEHRSIKKKYNHLLKKYNNNCVIFVSCTYIKNHLLPRVEYYLAANEKEISIISTDEVPKILRISYDMISHFILSVSANSTHPNYASNKVEFEIYYYNNQEDRENNILSGNIIFISGIYSFSRKFNKYAFKQCNFYEYIRQYIPEKATNIAI